MYYISPPLSSPSLKNSEVEEEKKKSTMRRQHKTMSSLSNCHKV